MKRILILLGFLFAFATMQAQDFPIWLEGTWEIPSQSAYSGSSYEEWTKISASQWEGKTYRMFGNDTIVFDRMKMIAEGDKIVIKMSAEKGGKRSVADFVGTKICDELWAFECSESDSPSAIYYRNLGTNQIYVWTEVNLNYDVCVDFTMRRLK